MLKPKVAKEILKVCLPKQEITQKFLQIYGCKPAIRLIKKDSFRVTDEKGLNRWEYKYTFGCDKCGELFVTPECDGKQVKCPKCGHKIKIENYWGDRYYLDDTYEGYSHIFSKKNKIIEPSTAIYEVVSYEGYHYHVFRRFHFSLDGGKITDIRMAKCIIAGVSKVRGGILMYENDEGEFRTSRPTCASSWFSAYKYGEIKCDNFLFDDGDEKSFDDHLTEVSDAYSNARRYYKPTIVKARELLDKYSVDENLSFADYGEKMEVYDEYFVHRYFRGGTEAERWIYSYKDKVNTVMEFSDGEWVVTDENDPKDYYDSVFIRFRKELEGSFVDKLGLFCVVAERDFLFDERAYDRDGVYYLTNLWKYPIIETLAKIGLKDLIEGVCNHSIRVNDTRTRIWQRLCLSKANYDLLFAFQSDEGVCKILQHLNGYDQRVDFESLKSYSAHDIVFDIEAGARMMRENKLTFKQVVDYMRSVEENQGYKALNALGTWRDYINMFEEYYGYRPKEKADRYPDSLKKAHDVISMYLSKKKENAEDESFASVNEKWKRLLYQDDQFCIKMPASSADLNLESKELGHCVHSYSRYVRDGDSVILFLRKVSEPDKPFFTIEFDCKDRLVQIRGRSNREINDINDKHKKLREDMILFLRKWGRLKHIRTGFEKETANAA